MLRESAKIANKEQHKSFYRCFVRSGVSLVSFRCFDGFGSFVPVVSFGVSGFSTCKASSRRVETTNI